MAKVLQKPRMIPIGIVTRNRHHYLDVTLRSLSAAHLPDDQILIVFDDASDDPATQKYLYTNEQVHLLNKWPKGASWRAINLNEVWSRKQGPGIADLVPVVKLHDSKLGVVNACCRAIVKLCDLAPNPLVDTTGILMIQDDVVFNEDFFTKLVKQARNPQPGDVMGLLMGCVINKSNRKKRSPTLVPSKGVTAQCAWILPAGLPHVHKWALRHHKQWTGFDNKLCAAVRKGGAMVYRCWPAVCQHIGIVSGVRPGWRWNRVHHKGRVDYSARGPYPLCEEIRSFKKGAELCLPLHIPSDA